MERSHIGAALVLLFVAGLKLMVLDQWYLLGDEAYYARWSEELAWGYYDQPPMIAWMLAAARWCGESDTMVRVVAVLCGLLGAWAHLTQAKDPVWVAAWWVGCPPLLWLTSFTTSDAPLLLGWSLVLVGASHGGRGWWLAAFGAWLAMLSKYTGVLALPLAWFAVRDRSPHAWGAFVLAGVGTLPHVAWLLEHDGVSIGFQLTEGVWNPNAPGWLGPIQVGLQQGLVGTPLLALAAVWAWVQPFGSRSAALGWWTSLPLFVLFLMASVGGPPEAHWLAPAWLGVGWMLDGRTDRVSRLAFSGLGLGGFASLLLVAHTQWGVFRIPVDPADRVRWGRPLAYEVGAWALPPGVGPREPGVERARRVRTERYQEAAWIWWYTGIDAVHDQRCGRPDQYELWDEPEPTDFLFVRPTTQGPLTCVPGATSRHRLAPERPDGRILREWDVFEVHP